MEKDIKSAVAGNSVLLRLIAWEMIAIIGCCLSLSSRDADSSPYSPGATQEHHGDSSSRAINAAPAPPSRSEPPSLHHSLSHPNITPSRPSQSDPRRRIPSNLPLSEHYNQPIRPRVWRSKRRSWSKAQLAREREEFFETRVTGRPEVWAALAAATSLLREGDIATAQGIIDAAGVTVPTGDICDGCYDENGGLYRLPEAIVSDPVNVVDPEDDGDDDDDDDSATCRRSGELGDEVSSGKLAVEDIDSDEELEEILERRREEKGKGNERDYIKVTARLSDRGGPDVIVAIGKDQLVSSLARRIQADAGIRGKLRVRIAYLGKFLKEHESLISQGWKEGHVVNALVVSIS
ncbi:hypothetical protein AJ80_07284 [Polytolypa hystricis UAMH7299]|uniref:DC-UbP/UBTD2 N-terminal domain-containing protein n=1 Tax=Polytolypa hystricis (strain UAMH7299) TaxID=1447883 RepID=A0A2B7XPK5_POLH7|nr:hypothetical protein AJ80_07284 [Polytolypa hystricis UAMH7299]